MASSHWLMLSLGVFLLLANPAVNLGMSTHPPVNASLIQCADLLMGQYLCLDPVIDPKTQQAKGCQKDRQLVEVDCMPGYQVQCHTCTPLGPSCGSYTFNGTEVGFKKQLPCRWTNGHSFEVALLLSIFLGMFGIDRFYLGYPAIGLLKLCTLGFLFLGQLVDILLIASQVVTPSDGSAYVVGHYGAGLTRLDPDNMTYYKPQET